jgi:type I restriction enzyme S subunit
MNRPTLVPRLRFTGAFSEWEERRLNNVSRIYDGTHQTPVYVKSGVPFYSVEHVTANDFSHTKYISEDVYRQECKRVRIAFNDILMTRIGDIGTPRIVDWDVKASFYVSLALIKPSEDINPRFLVQYMQTPFFQREMWRRTIHVAFPKKINLGEIGNCTLRFPSNDEQRKIADFLASVDQKIEATNNKLKMLQDYKKSVIRAIFNQELRLKDEGGKQYPEWQKKTLGEIGEFKTSSIDKISRPGEISVSLVNYMDVYRHQKIAPQNLYMLSTTTASEAQLQTNNLRQGDILFTPSSETPSDIGHSIVIPQDLHATVYSYHLVRFRPKVRLSLGFSHYFCNVPAVLKQISVLCQGSTRFTISVKDFSKVSVQLPTSYEEQERIADFLSTVDDKIRLEEGKLELTKKYKKALLQQMFV